MKKNQLGLTILELLISLTVGLFLFAGVLSVFIGMRTTTEETTSYGALQENARFALNIISEDLARQAFWGGAVKLWSSFSCWAPVVGYWPWGLLRLLSA